MTDLTDLPIFETGLGPASFPDSPNPAATRGITGKLHALAGTTPRRMAADPTTAVAPAAPSWAQAGGAGHTVPPTSSSTELARAVPRVDWRDAKRLQFEASETLSARKATLEIDEPLSDEAERELARSVILQVLDTDARTKDAQGGFVGDDAHRQQLAKAIFDLQFGYGRLQRLLDDDTVEDIRVTQSGAVLAERAGGTVTVEDPIADSDADLIEQIQTWAKEAGRDFSEASPLLHMKLADGARLTACAWVSPSPGLVIRRHRLNDITLDEMVERKSMSPVMASFLAAAVRARKSIIVCGDQGAGKTTLLRALATQIPAHERIVTIETEIELGLHLMSRMQCEVWPFEARPGTGEFLPDGRRAGEVTLADLLTFSFRASATRQIVGEVRGPEIWPMIKAMESGAGSLSTTHSVSAQAALRKLATCGAEAGVQYTPELVTAKLAETVDYVVQTNQVMVPTDDPKRMLKKRFVSEIVAIHPGEARVGYAHTPLFVPDPAGPGPAVPGLWDDASDDLVAYGFDRASYDREQQRGIA